MIESDRTHVAEVELEGPDNAQHPFSRPWRWSLSPLVGKPLKPKGAPLMAVVEK